MTDPVAANRVSVWRGGERVGTLTRTPHGAVFEIDEAWAAASPPGTPDVAITLPTTRRRFETHGVNLPPFFAGLLPEGLRLRALVRTVKTSEDDLFSLLAASGSDTIGDVSVGAGDAEPATQEPEADVDRTAEVSFGSLLGESLARAGSAGHSWSVAGVQPKISAGRALVPVRARGSADAWILKFGLDDLPRLVENEEFFLGVAGECGLTTPEFRVVRDREAQSGLLVRRFDRSPVAASRRARVGEVGGAAALRTADEATDLQHSAAAPTARAQRAPRRAVGRVHVEDACQFLDRYPADKYRLSLREVAEGLAEVCAAGVPAVAWLVRLHAFSWAIGNGDLHAKNVSVLRDPRSGRHAPAPVYDLVSTLPYGDDRMALPMDGRDRNLRHADFVAFAARLGVRPAATSAILDEVRRGVTARLPDIERIGLDERRTAHMRRTIAARLDSLSPS